VVGLSAMPPCCSLPDIVRRCKMELVIRPGSLGLTDYGMESTTSGSAGPMVGGLHKCEGSLTVCIPPADSTEVWGHAALEEGVHVS